ncbi:unnamed protein product, partial [Mortierella alpina]
MPKHSNSSSSSSSRKAAPPPQDHRHSSESGAEDDHDDHDDQDDQDDDQDQDQEQDQDQDQDEGRPRLNGGSAPVKRKRLTQACDPCRKKKIKCDGLKPSCANCAKLSLNCTYLPSMKKRGPRQGYIELLEKRLDKMEKMLQHGPNAVDPDLLDAKLRGASDGEADDPDSLKGLRTAKPDSLYFGGTSAFSHYNDSNKTMNHPFLQGDKILAATNNMTMTKTRRPIYGIRDEIPRKDILDHLIQLFFDSVYFQFPIIHPASFMKQYREGKVSPNLLNAMCAGVARFSNHPDVATTPSFLAGEPFATNVRGSLIDAVDVPSVSNVQALILLAMYEYGAARGPRAWMFGGMAIRMAQELGLNREDSSPVFYLKGDWVMRETRRRAFWSCFVMDVLASSSSGRPRMIDQRDCEVLLPSEDNAWHEARPVVTEMLDDDLDSAPNKGSSTEQQQPRPETKQPTSNDRNADDQLNATSDSATAGNHGPADSNTTEPHAAEQARQGNDSQPGHSLSSFAYLIRILAVLGKVSQYVNRPRTKNSIPPNEPGSEFAIIDAALKAWLNAVPPHLQYSQTNARMLKDRSEGSLIVFMHVLYHTSVVLLHRPILAADKASFPMDSNFIETSIARCAEAADNVSNVLDFVSAQNCPPRVYISSFFAYPVFTTATIHITNAFAQDPAVAAKARRNLSTHVRVLQTMKTYWAMADKFFYIIRDLYSIQSKISSSAANGGIIVPQVVSHNAHKNEEYPNGPCSGAKAADSDRGRGDGSGKDKQESTRHELDGLGAAPRMVINSKLASISSFLKSDSGLIALWRRATEMQVIDKANQEKRKATLAEPSVNKPQALPVKAQGEIEPSTEGEEQREQRIRMNDLEIQEINQEFERQWKSKMLAEQQQQQQQQQEDSAGAATVVSEEPHHSGASQRRKEEPASVDKRQTEGDDLSNPRASKLPRTAQPALAAPQPQSRSQSNRKHRSGSNSTPSMDGDTAASHASSATATATAAWTAPTGRPIPHSDASSNTADGSGAYNHTLLQRPQQLQEFQSQQAFVMQPMIVQPRVSGAVDMTQTSEVNQHLLNAYSQQRQAQEALARSIEMRQNANIQRQQQHLQQQQQQAPVSSSLAFGPPGGGGFTPGSSAFLASSIASLPSQVRANHFQPQSQQQQGQQALFAGTPFAGPPLVYGSSYSHQQTPRVQTEPIDSIFDFAMPLGDLNFLSSSFQMTPMMMQEANNGRGNTMESYPASTVTSSRGMSGLSSAIPASSLQPQQTQSSQQAPRPQRPQQRARAGSATSSTSAMSPVPSATASSPATPAVSGSMLMVGAQVGMTGGVDLTPASAQGRDVSHSKSPSVNGAQEISPGLHSFMMSDEA